MLANAKAQKVPKNEEHVQLLVQLLLRQRLARGSLRTDEGVLQETCAQERREEDLQQKQARQIFLSDFERCLCGGVLVLLVYDPQRARSHRAHPIGEQSGVRLPSLPEACLQIAMK